MTATEKSALRWKLAMNQDIGNSQLDGILEAIEVKE
jgi:hypothetical protein